jgi:hypothetical protein
MVMMGMAITNKILVGEIISQHLLFFVISDSTATLAVFVGFAWISYRGLRENRARPTCGV